MVPEIRPQQGPLRVLVIEDEVLIRAAIAEDLRGAGLTVVEAVNADEAWAYLQAGSPVDLVFSDVHLPGSMDGLEFARRIAEDYPDLRIILTSGNVAPRAAEKFGRFLPKPYSIESAVELILETLGLDSGSAQ